MSRYRALATLVLTLLMCASSAAARQAKPRTGELPDGILHYEPVVMLSSMAAANQAATSGVDTVQLSFDTLGRQFDLTLEPHSPFAKGATVRWVDDAGVVEEPANGGPFFRGHVEGDPSSWVRLTVRGDTLAGIVATADEVYFLEPATNLFRDAAAGDTVAYRLSDVDTDWIAGSCAARAPSTQLRHRLSKLRAARSRLHELVADAATTLAAAGSLKEADIAIVADYEYFTRHGSTAATDIAAILNVVDGIYQAELGVTMQLLTTVVYTTVNDPFSSVTDPGTLLPEFSTWKGNNDDDPSELVWGADLTHLITGRDLNQNVIGIAYIAGLCQANSSVGVDQDFSSDVGMMGLLLSHEMGHNFGAYHDAQDGSPCASAPATYIMNPVLSAGLQRKFSACSKSSIAPVLSGATCLTDVAGPPPPPGPPVLNPIAQPLVVGGTVTLTGSNFTPGSVLKLFIATSSGTVARGPYAPSSWRSTSLTFSPLDPTIPLGRGFTTAMIINTDQGFTASNTRGQYLYGSPSVNLPTITAVGGVNLRPFDPKIPLASVETVVGQGQTVTITGTGFNSPLVNLFTATGNKGPLTPLSGGTSTQIRVVIPSGTPTGPGSFQVVNNPYSGNVISNAVSVPIGALVAISGVTQVGSMVTVRGSGFSVMSVINFFNGGGNLGGLGGTGPRIPLIVDSDQQFHFTAPANGVTGPAYIQVLNPPYIPFSSSGTDPDGGFWLTATN